MSRKILASLDSFKEIIEEESLYVDKTSLISELLEFGDKLVAITRPRRFGKSLNMSMLSYFFDINNAVENRKLFKGLDIEKSPYFKEQGQYPVINLSFKDFKKGSFKDCYSKIVKLIIAEYDRHSYLNDSSKLSDVEKANFKKILAGKGDQSDYESSLADLSKYLSKHYGKKVIILVDEYDTPVIEGELNGYFEEASGFMQNFLGEALKGNESIFKGVVTGITRLQGAGIFSGVNSVDICTILDKEYKDKFGFTEKEVKELLKEYGIEDKEEGVREYYNGYNIQGEVIYNPYSVVKFLKKRKFGNFWLSSSSNDLAKKKVNELLEMSSSDVIRKKIEDLMQGKSVRTEIEEVLKISGSMDSGDILNLLLYSGYLKYNNVEEGSESLEFADLSIPNVEIKGIYKKTINEWMRSKYTERELEDLNKFLRSVCEGSEGEIKERLENYLNRRSILDGEKVLEMGYHNFLFGLLQGLEGKYLLDSNRESGSGRCDIMLTPIKGKGDNKERSGVVIELKVGDKDKLKEASKGAIKQIEEKKYYRALENQGIRKVRLVGIAFNGKEAEVTLKEL